MLSLHVSDHIKYILPTICTTHIILNHKCTYSINTLVYSVSNIQWFLQGGGGEEEEEQLQEEEEELQEEEEEEPQGMRERENCMHACTNSEFYNL